MVLIPYDRHFRRLWHSSFVCSPDVVAVRKLVSWSVCGGCGRIAVEKLAGPATCTLLPWVPWHHGDDVVESTADERRSSVSRSLSIRSSPTTQRTRRWRFPLTLTPTQDWAPGSLRKRCRRSCTQRCTMHRWAGPLQRVQNVPALTSPPKSRPQRKRKSAWIRSPTLTPTPRV